MSLLITLENLEFTYFGAEEPSLKNINLSVKKGEFVVLAGPSGCGKSTLCLCLNSIIPHLLKGRMKGRVLVNGRDTRNLTIPELSRDVGLVFQNPDNQIFALTVEEDIAFGPENLGLPRPVMEERVVKALLETRMEPFRKKFVYNLSGGQKQRTAIAGILAMNPGVLVFDEPTADLDPKGTREVLETIHRLNRDEGRTVIIVEHKIRQVLSLCDRVLWMEEGKIVSEHEPNGPLPPLLARGYRRENGPADRRTDTGQTAIRIQDVSFSYQDGTEVLKAVNLTVREGELLAIIGENGSGKSTLAMHLNGLLKPKRGNVVIWDKNTRDTKPGQMASLVGYLFQNPDHQIFSESVYNEVAIGLKHAGLSTEKRDRVVHEALKAVDLGGYADRDPNTISRGERQRLAVATVLALNPRVIVFDEPTTGQDAAHILDIMRYIENINRQGRTVVMITHDMDLAWSYADRIVVMAGGRIIHDAPVSDTSVSVPDMFRCPSKSQSNLVNGVLEEVVQ